MATEFAGYPVTVRRRSNCRRMTVRMKIGDSAFTLTVPMQTGEAEILAFLQRHRSFLHRHAPLLSSWQPAFAAGERHRVLGRFVTLGEDGVPCGEAAFEAWRFARLRACVAELLPVWETRSGLTPSQVRWRPLQSAWGKCVQKTGLITLSTRLALLPEPLIEYVLVHELCHLRHPDHSPAFHAFLERLMPDAPQREYETGHYDWRPLPPAHEKTQSIEKGDTDA